MQALIGKQGRHWAVALLLLFGVLSESLPDHHHDDHACVEDEGQHFEVVVEDLCEGNEHQHDAQVVGLDEDSHEHNNCALCQLAHFYSEKTEPSLLAFAKSVNAVIWLRANDDSCQHSLLPRGPPSLS